MLYYQLCENLDSFSTELKFKNDTLLYNRDSWEYDLNQG